MNNNDFSNQKMYQDNWNHDKYVDVNKDDKNQMQGKNSKPRKPFNRFNNDVSDNSSQIVNTKTLVADFIDQPKKQLPKKQNVIFLIKIRVK
jgi:hypothetical protein